MLRTEVASAFLKALFGDPIPSDSAIEIRVKRNQDAGAAQQWLVRPSLRVESLPLDAHVWFGVSLRKHGTTTGKLGDLTWCSCVWADFDKLSEAEKLVKLGRLQRFSHPPHVVVDSGGGLHAYWRLDRPLDMQDDAQRTYVREVVHGLAHVLGADVSVHDPTRLLRVPGTYNPGNGKDKVYDPAREVKVLHSVDGAYRVEDLSRYRRPLVHKSGGPRVEAPATAPPSPGKLNVSRKWQKLIRDGWTQGCGYATRSELDQAVMVALAKGGHTDDEILGVFMDASNGISAKFFDKGTDGPRYLAHTLQAARGWVQVNAGQPDPSVQVREHNGVLQARRSGKNGTEEWETVFNRPIKAVAELYGEETGYQVEIATPHETRSLTLTSEDTCNNVAFKRALKMSGSWMGTDRDVQVLIAYLEAQNPPRRRAVRTIGWHDDTVMFPNVILGPAGTVDSSEFLYLGSLTQARLTMIDDWPQLAADLAQVLPTLHDAGALLPTVGWLFATFLAPQIRRLSDNAFPFLMVFGEPESGKTTLLENLWRLTGMSSTLRSSTPTKYALIEMLSASNTMPVILDEHRREDLRHHAMVLYPLLREAYQAGIHARGRADLSIRTYRLSTPVAIAGETPFRDPALVHRTIHVMLTRRGKNEQALKDFQALRVDDFAGGFYQHVRTKDLNVLWDEVLKELPAPLVNEREMRQRHAWRVAALGLRLLEPYWTRQQTQQWIQSLDANYAETTQAVGTPTRAVVHEAIRVIAELVKGKKIREGTEFTIKRLDEQPTSPYLFWFVDPLVLPLVEEYFTRIPTELTMNRDTVRARLKAELEEKTGLVPHFREPFRMGKRTARGIALSLDAIEQELGIPVNFWTEGAVDGSSHI